MKPPRIISEFLGNIELIRGMNNYEKLPYNAGVVSDETTIEQCRQLFARTGLRRGSIKPNMVGEDGVLKPSQDPYRDYSEYFAVHDQGLLVATGRLIRADENHGGIEAFQIHWEDLSEKSKQPVCDIDPNKLAEFASLVKEEGGAPIATQFLFREMIKYSLENGITHWVCGLQKDVSKKYEKIFGFALTKLGEEVRLANLNAQYVPYLINLENLYERFQDAGRTGPAGRLGGEAIAHFYTSYIPDIHQPRYQSEKDLTTL